MAVLMVCSASGPNRSMARPTIIDFYGINNLEFQDEYKHRDISDEIHLYFEVNIKFSNIANRSISVALRQKDAEREL